MNRRAFCATVACCCGDARLGETDRTRRISTSGILRVTAFGASRTEHPFATPTQHPRTLGGRDTVSPRMVATSWRST
jgi:hypothetical protein